MASAGIKQELHTTEMDFPLPVLNLYHADAPVCTPAGEQERC